MHEFNNRIDAQREILRSVNALPWRTEKLLGLSSKAILRWSTVNQLDQTSRLIEMVTEAASCLFFLANKSQEQITDNYSMKSSRVAQLSSSIQNEVANLARIQLS